MRHPRKQSSDSETKRLLDRAADPPAVVESLYPFNRSPKPTEWHRAQSHRINAEVIQRTDEHIHFVLVEILDELRKLTK